jgi:hypothetical protein
MLTTVHSGQNGGVALGNFVAKFNDISPNSYIFTILRNRNKNFTKYDRIYSGKSHQPPTRQYLFLANG